jgi:hypothetical protein
MGLFPEVKLFVLNLNLSLKDESDKSSKGLVRKQASVYLHGATGAGKTTMLEKTTGKSQEELQRIERSFGNEPPRLIGQKGDFAFVIDSPGEASARREGIRTRSLNNLKPLAILLLLDHAPRGRENEDIYKCPNNGDLPDNPAHPIQIRFEEHKKAIDELSKVFFANPAIAKRCRLVLPIVNKRDAWEKMGYTLHIFTSWYYDVLQTLNISLANNNIHWHRPIALAGQYEGFGNTLSIVNEYAGKELVIKLAENPFFTATARLPMAQKAS